MSSNLSTFKKDMQQEIEKLKSGGSSHKYIQCQILVLKFMKDVLSNTNDKETIENLIVWEEKCEDAKDLVQEFSRWIMLVQPPFMKSIGCRKSNKMIKERFYVFGRMQTIHGEIRPMYFSVFVLDWMVRTSKFLSDVWKTAWSTNVLKDWFESQEDATNFLDRAEYFFENPGLVDEIMRSFDPKHFQYPLMSSIQLQKPYMVQMK
jgi:hypothetical protein